MNHIETTPIVRSVAVEAASVPNGPGFGWDIADLLGLRSADDQSFVNLPFGPGDTTAGSETELQAVVIGRKEDVDLPISIAASNYFSNLVKRSAAQDTPKRALRELRRFLDDNPRGVWENSWVRFPRQLLSPAARAVLEHDLSADKTDPKSVARSDVGRFMFPHHNGELWLRLPISYVLKLALADVLGTQSGVARQFTSAGRRLLPHFLSDNTSPETYSFHVVRPRPGRGLGRGLARETATRLLLTQLLTMYANDRFGLRSSGQEAVVYLSPHPPVRQQQLNDCIADSFYRELFCSPCLSGWNRGEDKRDYMRLCHQVLSRSQLHALAKVRDAGLIAGNLVVLPRASNVSLANNGIHVSLGSRRLAALREDGQSGFDAAEEKRCGDLVIKIVEHFLPLFVGTYSAAPYRLDFADFHAERVLGFLPHELDFTHLRMFWRRWKKKARVKILGCPVSPTGYGRFDRLLSAAFRLRGDFVPDYRLIDYLVSPLSTDESPALDGRPGNSDRLKRDLADQGVFDERMSTYLLYRMRGHAEFGYSGFEGRHYSLCESLEDDLGRAVDLQNLVTALAWRYVTRGEITHADIPDDPTIESERRQIIFGAAVGIPTFYVGADSGNRFLRKVIAGARRTRSSRRYAGYVRVHNLEYRRALLDLIRRDAAGLIEALGLAETIADLDQRINDPQRHSALGRLTRGILEELGARSPLAVPATEFNQAAEQYFRHTLRRRQMRETFRMLEADWQRPPSDDDPHVAWLGPRFPQLRDPLRFLRAVQQDAVDGTLAPADLRALINWTLLTIQRDADTVAEPFHLHACDGDIAPVY